MKPKILLVDDLEDILAVVRKLLPGCDVSEAHNGAEALRLAAEQKPDLVVLDVHLPDMSGVDMMERFAAMDPKPVVIMLTGDATVETAGRGLAAGAFAYITKPFEAKDLLELVVKGLDFAEKEKARRNNP
ncbi:MAG: response regulator [Elusimicrobia bacterium]|nr:response regulator [Elusimicrobiota bacterium]